MIKNSGENKEKLENFLDKFKKDELLNLSLDRYTSVGEKRDDFTYWVEIKLDCFGGIKGGSSYKFGIYKCNAKPKERNGYKYDEKSKYAWVDNIIKGASYDDVFKEIRNRICSVVNVSSSEGDIAYDTIEGIDLGDAYKWKIAFLYSNNRLVPVYQKEALVTAAKRIGVYPENVEKITIAKLQEVLMKYFDEHKKEYDNDICKFGRYVWKIGTSDLSQSNQIIKYGAPGTGKTYTTKIEAEEFFEIWKMDSGNTTAKFSDHYEFVQFHPSYSYEDFIEGIKPVLEKGKTELKLKNGIFKAFCKKAAEYELWLIQNDDLKNKNLAEVTYKDVKEIRSEGNPFVFPKAILS